MAATAAARPVAKPAPSASSSGGGRAPPAPPRAVPKPPPAAAQPKVPLYKVKYAFEGQEGELSLKKDDILELVKKEDNGWWLMKKDGVEGWAPENYLELVPPKGPEPAAPPPPPRAPVPKPPPANASAKPVAVFPGAVANGASSAPPWKKNNTGTDTAAAKPPVASKPKPPPVVANKPGGAAGGRPPAKPPVPSAARPGGAAPTAKPGGVSKPSAPVGQLDLAAAVSRKIISQLGSSVLTKHLVGKEGPKDSRRVARLRIFLKKNLLQTYVSIRQIDR